MQHRWMLTVSRFIIAVALAAGLVAGTAVVLVVQPTPAMACNGGGC
jgi:hypothetical protein